MRERKSILVNGEASWAEYFMALKVMAAHPALPQGWGPALEAHEQELISMAIKWVGTSLSAYSRQQLKVGLD